MTTIVGQFDVTLSVPLSVSPEFKPENVEPLQLTIQESAIFISALNITYDSYYDEYIGTSLNILRVIIRRPAVLGEDGNLMVEEERTFELHLIEAVQRLAGAVKLRTNNWGQDVQHPIRAYASKYSSEDASVGTVHPLAVGDLKVPDYYFGSITTDVAGLVSELSPASWEQLELDSAAEIPHYEERLADARFLKSLLRYEAAILYFAMAAELMIIEAGEALFNLRKIDRPIDKKKNDGSFDRTKTRQIITAIAKHHIGFKPLKKKLNQLFDWRRDLAHGRPIPEADDRVADALAITLQTNQELQNWLRR